METDRKWIVIRIDGKLAGISRDYDRLAEISARIAEEHRLRDASGKKRKTIKDEPLPYLDIQATAVDFGQVLKLRQETRWEDLMLFGTDFQKRVWKKIWELTAASTECQTTTENLVNTRYLNTPENENIPEDQKVPEGGTGMKYHIENDADQSAKSIRSDAGNISTKSASSRAVRELLSYTDFAELCDNRAGVRAIAHAVGLNPLPVVIPCHLIVPKEAIDRIEDIRRKAESTIFRGEDLCTSAILEDPAIDFGEYALGKKLKRHLIRMDLQ